MGCLYQPEKIQWVRYHIQNTMKQHLLSTSSGFDNLTTSWHGDQADVCWTLTGSFWWFRRNLHFYGFSFLAMLPQFWMIIDYVINAMMKTVGKPVMTLSSGVNDRLLFLPLSHCPNYTSVIFMSIQCSALHLILLDKNAFYSHLHFLK